MKYCALVSLLSLVSFSSAGVVRLKLNKVDPVYNANDTAATYAHTLKRITNKFTQSQIPFSDLNNVQISSANKEVALPITNYMNAQYYSTVSVGEPKQDFNVILDTGSSNFWVPSSRCLSIPCFLHTRYSHSNSATYVANGTQLEISYGSGRISGVVSQDTMHIGDLKIANQSFIEATVEPNLNFAFGKFDGIVGLAFDSISIGGVVSPLQNMVSQGLLDEKVFSFYLGDQSSESEVIFGGVNPKHYKGELIKLPLRRKAYWEVKLDSIAFGSSVQTMENTGAVLDTGTSLMIFSTEMADILNKQIGAEKSMFSFGQYMIECNKIKDLPSLTFKLAGHDFSIGPEDYIMNISGTCISTIAGMDIPSTAGKFIILGDSFLRKYYAVHNFGDGTISLAPSKP